MNLPEVAGIFPEVNKNEQNRKTIKALQNQKRNSILTEAMAKASVKNKKKRLGLYISLLLWFRYLNFKNEFKMREMIRT